VSPRAAKNGQSELWGVANVNNTLVARPICSIRINLTARMQKIQISRNLFAYLRPPQGGTPLTAVRQSPMDLARSSQIGLQ
jgi:hypothetical protein